MPAWVGPAISAAASLVGGMMGNKSNEAMAGKTRAWMTTMDNTKYQRSTADLKAAGLNPMLAYMNGVSSAGTPPTPQMQDVVSPAVNSANTARMTGAQTEFMDAQTQQALATAANQQSMTRANTANAILTENENTARYGDQGSITTADGMTYTSPNLNMLDIQKRMADIASTKAQTDFVKGQLPKTLAEIENLVKTNKLTEAQTKYSELQSDATRLGFGKLRAESAAYESALGALLPFIPGISNSVNSANGMKNLFRSSKPALDRFSIKTLTKTLERRAND